MHWYPYVTSQMQHKWLVNVKITPVANRQTRLASQNRAFTLVFAAILLPIALWIARDQLTNHKQNKSADQLSGFNPHHKWPHKTVADVNQLNTWAI